MSSLKSLQSIPSTITIYSYATDVTIAAVVMANTFVVIQTTHPTSSTNVSEGSVSCQLTSTTNVHLQRGIANDWAPTVNLLVIEITGATVQRGNATVVVYGTNVTISSVDLTKSFAYVTLRGSSVSTLGHLITSIVIQSQTVIVIRNSAGVESPVAEWQVMTIDDVVVQVSNGSNTSYSSLDIPITPVVLANSLIFFSCNVDTGTVSPSQLPIAYFYNNSTVRIKSYQATTKFHSLFVLTCPNWNVQHFYAQYSSNINNITIASVDTSKTMSLLNGCTNVGYASVSSNTFDYGNFGCKQILTTATNAQITRGASSGNFYIASQIWYYGSGIQNFITSKAYEYDCERGYRIGYSI